MTDGASKKTTLRRITENPELARAVPRLHPELLHAIVDKYGLADCGELLLLATPNQLTALADLDLWSTVRAGSAEQFDAERFCEWIEVLADLSPEIAAERLSHLDVAVVSAGFSSCVTVWDPAVLTASVDSNAGDALLDRARERGVHTEIGRYVVIARGADAWDPIVDVLRALDEHHPEAFHRVMRACRRASNSGWERDGLDDLLVDPDQMLFDVSATREQRRECSGYLSPEQAHAFLASSRTVAFSTESPRDDPAWAAYRKSLAAFDDVEVGVEGGDVPADRIDPISDDGAAVAAVIEVLRDAGVVGAAFRALLPAAPGAPVVHAALTEYLGRRPDSSSEWSARQQELGFLANALVAGSAVQGRRFDRREALDAVAAICNLGLEHWPAGWPPSSSCGLVSVFQVGWSILHRDVSMMGAKLLLQTLQEIRTTDRELAFGLAVLSRELRKQYLSGTPWHARDRLELLSSLDLSTWAALTALFGECPVMLANVSASPDHPPLRVDPTEFQFIATAADIAAVRAFLHSLPHLLVG
jgi:hypothetical protein